MSSLLGAQTPESGGGGGWRPGLLGPREEGLGAQIPGSREGKRRAG